MRRPMVRRPLPPGIGSDVQHIFQLSAHRIAAYTEGRALADSGDRGESLQPGEHALQIAEVIGHGSPGEGVGPIAVRGVVADVTLRGIERERPGALSQGRGKSEIVDIAVGAESSGKCRSGET